jgi:hypothetical protein
MNFGKRNRFTNLQRHDARARALGGHDRANRRDHSMNRFGIKKEGMYELLDKRNGRAEPFETIWHAIEWADKRKLGSYNILEVKCDGSRILKLSVST